MENVGSSQAAGEVLPRRDSVPDSVLTCLMYRQVGPIVLGPMSISGRWDETKKERMASAIRS